jgi:hypothetical protein
MVTVTLPVEGSLPPVLAATVTVPPAGGVAGAVNVPLDATLPQAPEAVLEQLTLQVGVMVLDSSVAVKACVPPATTVALVGVITIGAGVTVTVAEAV